MVNKPRSEEESLGNKSENLKSTNPATTSSEPTKASKLETSKPDETTFSNVVENFDNRGNGVTDNKPVGWEDESPAGTVIYGSDSMIPSENAVVSGVVSTAVYAGENEFDDKGLKDSEPEPEPEPPVDPEA